MTTRLRFRIRSALVLRVTAIVGFALGTAVASCVGAGEGHTQGTVHVPICGLEFPRAGTTEMYQLPLNYFPAERTGRDLHFRAQYGGGTAEYTDGLYFRFRNTEEVQARLLASAERDAATGVQVLTLPVGSADSLVQAYLNFHFSCGRTKATRLGQNVSLPAVRGNLVIASIDGGNADPARITDVRHFELVFDDPRPIGDPAPEGFSPLTAIGHAELTGQFRFHYSRSSPAQTFPGGP